MPSTRCAAHPARPAVDSCPVCDRPRCGADAAEARGGGCAICRGSAPVRARRPASRLELFVRCALAANLTAVVWGFVEAEYVQAGVFQYLAPLVLGAFTGGVAMAAVGQPRDQDGTRMRLIAVGYAVLGCAFGFVKEGTFGALSSSGDVLVPYLLAAVACWGWTLPPKPAAVQQRS
ncbi:MAG: hypothetical protein JWP14_2601 [Frankiales bacterium]|nr:hypothetical protein [Frankiales bacterium]